MGRSLPVECPHGYTFDWGDFGPSCPLARAANEDYECYCLDPDNCESCYPKCPDCTEEQHQRDEAHDREVARIRSLETIVTDLANSAAAVRLEWTLNGKVTVAAMDQLHHITTTARELTAGQGGDAQP
jgi:hypothetical protein